MTCRSSALNEVPSWQMNGLLAEWHENMNQRHKKPGQRWPVIMFTNTFMNPEELELHFTCIYIHNYNPYIYPVPDQDVMIPIESTWTSPDFRSHGRIGTSLVKSLQETEIHPVAYDTALRITMTWMTENLHQHCRQSHKRLRHSQMLVGVFFILQTICTATKISCTV